MCLDAAYMYISHFALAFTRLSTRRRNCFTLKTMHLFPFELRMFSMPKCQLHHTPTGVPKPQARVPWKKKLHSRWMKRYVWKIYGAAKVKRRWKKWEEFFFTIIELQSSVTNISQQSSNWYVFICRLNNEAPFQNPLWNYNSPYHRDGNICYNI